MQWKKMWNELALLYFWGWNEKGFEWEGKEEEGIAEKGGVVKRFS